jgi:hypothetical protein
VTGGTLAPYLLADSLSLSISFTNINSGGGFAVGAAAPTLNPFTADATLNIAADSNPIPEPAGILLLLVGVAITSVCSIGGRA